MGMHGSKPQIWWQEQKVEMLGPGPTEEIWSRRGKDEPGSMVGRILQPG